MDNWEDNLISEDDFFEEWGAFIRADGNMYSYNEIKDQPINNVWSISNSGGGRPDHWIAAPGIHFVNVIGFVLTKRPWTDYTLDAFFSFDDFD